MKSNFLRNLAWGLVWSFPVSIIITIITNGSDLTDNQLMLVLKFGLSTFAVGCLLLFLGVNERPIRITKVWMRFWILVLTASCAFLFLLMCPILEVYCGIDMPFVNISLEQFNCFGYDIPNHMQLGLMMLAGMFIMLPARTIHLSILKIIVHKKELDEQDEFARANDFTFDHTQN